MMVWHVGGILSYKGYLKADHRSTNSTSRPTQYRLSKAEAYQTQVTDHLIPERNRIKVVADAAVCSQSQSYTYTNWSYAIPKTKQLCIPTREKQN